MLLFVWFCLVEVVGLDSGGPSCRTALRRTAQKFALFFPSSCHNFQTSFSLLGSFRGNGCGAAGVSHDNPKRAHFRAPALPTPPKFHERTPRERKKKENCGGRREEKARNFAPPTLRGPTLLVPPFGASLFLGLAPCGPRQ